MQFSRKFVKPKLKPKLKNSPNLPMNMPNLPVKNRGKRGLNWPGYNYLGPGNPLNNGEPISEVDSIAQEHDWKYEFAEHSSHIKEADDVAISQFNKKWQSGQEIIPSLAGSIGLNIKKHFENFVGVQYPTSAKLNFSKLRNSKLRAFGLSRRKRHNVNF